MRTIEETIEYLRNAYIKLQRYENRSDALYASGDGKSANYLWLFWMFCFNKIGEK